MAIQVDELYQRLPEEMVCSFKWAFVLLQVQAIVSSCTSISKWRTIEHCEILNSFLIDNKIFCVLGAKLKWLTLVEGQ